MNLRFAGVFQAVPIVLAILLPVCVPSAAAQMTVTGESLHIERSAPTIGDVLSMTLRFRVEGIGAAIPIAFSAVESARSPDPDRPTVPSRRYDIRPGTPHLVKMEYRLPRPVPAEMCFNVYAHFTGTGLRSALLVQNACWGATTRSGTGQRVDLKPDLTVRIDAVSVDRTIDTAPGDAVSHPLNLSFTIRNVGTSPTERTGVCWALHFHLPRAQGAWAAGWNQLATGVCEVIPGGGSQRVSQVFNIPEAVDKIRVEADPRRLWGEYSEDNNTDERLIGVPPRIRGTEPVRPDIRRK